MTDPLMPTARPRAARAFTLVELLVVIGIIALLISILLPALGKARKSANTVKDSANLHSIMLAFQIYAAQNHDYLMGSPLTTGFYNDTVSGTVGNGNSPYTIQSTDWMTPAMDIMGVKITYSAGADANRTNGQARWDRVNAQLNYPGFHDPENQTIMQVYNGSTYFTGATNVPAVAPYVSYATSWVFFLQNINDPIPPAIAAAGLGGNLSNAYAYPPPGYAPKFAKIGAGNNKICISDGGRYVNFSNSSFDMTFNSSGTQGGAYSDYGPWSSYANGHQRNRAPGAKTSSGAVSTGADERVLWARHGTNVTGAPDSAFRFNAAFFDGHVETLTVDQGTNPNLWGPKGSTFVTSEFYADVATKYNVPASSPTVDGKNYLIPN